jgi:hypothetical protein
VKDDRRRVVSAVRARQEGSRGHGAREKALQARTAALNQSIEQLQQLPLTLGKQTSEYIAMGVRQAIKDDFSRPIESAVKGPLELLSREVYHARDVMAQVGGEVRFQTWRWVAFLVLIGVALGSGGCYFFFVRDLNQVNERLDSIQKQVMVAVPAPDAKPAIVPSTKVHHGSHAVAPTTP